MYVYIQPEARCWTVGFFSPDGRFNSESDHSTPEAAAERVARLNGALVAVAATAGASPVADATFTGGAGLYRAQCRTPQGTRMFEKWAPSAADAVREFREMYGQVGVVEVYHVPSARLVWSEMLEYFE